MNQVNFTKSEVLAFVEDLILDQMATEDEQHWYEDLMWYDEFKTNYTYKNIIRKMRKVYEVKF